MKRTVLLIVFLVGAATLMQAQAQWSFKGTVTRMRMAECNPQRGLISTLAGTPVQAAGNCPEYTVMSDKVVYVVIGRRAEEFIPLAENMEFMIRKNELVMFSEDEKTKSRFVIQQMTLRADWDREEAQKELTARMLERSASYDTHNPPQSASRASSNTR